jgi:hypothetical protein
LLCGEVLLVGANRPEQRLNFSGVALSALDHFANVVALRLFNFNDTRSRLFQTVDRTLCQCSCNSGRGEAEEDTRQPLCCYIARTIAALTTCVLLDSSVLAAALWLLPACGLFLSPFIVLYVYLFC